MIAFILNKPNSRLTEYKKENEVVKHQRLQSMCNFRQLLQTDIDYNENTCFDIILTNMHTIFLDIFE